MTKQLFSLSARRCLKHVLTYRHRKLFNNFRGAVSLWTSRAFVVFDTFPAFSETSMPLKSSAVEAIIFAPDEGGIKTSWKSARVTDAGKAIGIGETVGVRSWLCVGVALNLFSRFHSLFLGEILPAQESDT
ncbi:hypothetical protein TNCV_4021521 [Trichonephila clavipes]|nr:hypothetical protein TNCV_4021521 [Trichonephila clavipes]